MRAHHWLGAVVILAVGFFVGAWWTRNHSGSGGA